MKQFYLNICKKILLSENPHIKRIAGLLQRLPFFPKPELIPLKQ